MGVGKFDSVWMHELSLILMLTLYPQHCDDLNEKVDLLQQQIFP